MTTEKLINDSVSEAKDVFDKLDINTSALDWTGKNEAMFNSVFIKSFLNRLNLGDYELFKKLRDDFLEPVNNIFTVDSPFSCIDHLSDSQE